MSGSSQTRDSAKSGKEDRAGQPIKHAPEQPSEPRPALEPSQGRPPIRFDWKSKVGLVALGAMLGVGLVEALGDRRGLMTASGPASVATVAAEVKRFENTLRVGGTIGATDFAMMRAPRMRGGRDRGGGGAAGGGSLTIEFLAKAGSIVRKGEVVAAFESKRTEDFLDNYQSTLAQIRSRAASRKADVLITAETLRQDYRKSQAEADKAELDLRTAEVKSEIQAEILKLLAQQNRESAKQLKEEVRLSAIADASALRSLEIDVEQSEKRYERTRSDLERMRIRTPVNGLVVVESLFTRDGFSQVAEGDQVNPGSYFLRVVDLSTMTLFATVNQVDSQAIDVGAPVSVRLDAFPDSVFQGVVSSIGAVAVAGGSSGGGRGSRGGSRGTPGQWVRQVPVEVRILSVDERIMPDLSGSGDIVVESRDNALVVPRSAVGRSNGRDVVWVQGDGGFAERAVRVGLLSDIEAIIDSGLRAGEVVASQPIADTRLLTGAGSS